MAYPMATIKSLVNKGLAKFKKQNNCSYDLSSSDSNSEQEIRCHDTELVVDTHFELDESFMSDLESV